MNSNDLANIEGEPKDYYIKIGIDRGNQIPRIKFIKPNIKTEENSDIKDESESYNAWKRNFMLLENRFNHQMNGFIETINQTILMNELMRSGLYLAELDEYVRFESMHSVKSKEDPDLEIYYLDKFSYENKSEEISKLVKRFELIDRIPEIFFIGIVTDFDNFLTNLYKNTFGMKSNFLRDLPVPISSSDIFEAKSIDQLKNRLLENHIGEFTRASIVEKFDMFHKKFDVKLSSLGIEFHKINEIFERRNCIVHNDGYINRKYANKNKNEGELKEGDKISISIEYINQSIEEMIFIYTIIYYGIAYHLKKDSANRHWLDRNFQSTCFNYIERGKWELSEKMYKYRIESKMKADMQDSVRYMYTINYAQCVLRNSGRSAAKKVLDAVDFSATGINFKICRHAILGEFTKATNLIERYAGNADISYDDYMSWPVFFELREHVEFQNVIDKIFGQ